MAKQTDDAATHQLQCMEIFGANRTSQRFIESPGLDIWLDSRELDGDYGGDVHYISTCGSGHVSRVTLADVSGHGAAVDQVARRLRDLMRKHINTFDQTSFAQQLNQDMLADEQSEKFATVLLMTYFTPTHHLVVCNAGHPRPLWFSTLAGEWRWLDENTPDAGESLRASRATYHLRSIANVPLGILQPGNYSQFAIQLAPGDRVILYTDGVTEAQNPAGELLGERRWLELVRGLGPLPARQLGPALLRALDDWRGGAAPDDDQTLLVLEHTASGPPQLNLVRTLRTLMKLIGLSRV